jgi:type III secretion protein D
MMRESLELVVDGGPQQGARLPLVAGSNITIGSAFGNDIVLRDSAIPAHALRLHPGTGSCEWQVTNAEFECVVNESALALNDVVSVVNGSTVRLGHSSLSVVSICDAPDSAGTGQLQAADEQPSTEPGNQRRGKRFQLLLLSGSVLVLGAVVAMWWYQAQTQITSSLPSVTALLAASPFRALVADVSGDVALVNGFVNTQHEKLELATLLNGANQPVQLNVTVGEHLARAVEDVYRTNGVDAEVVATDAGRVEVRTSVADADRLKALESAVRADVPQVSSLKLINTPPKIVKTHLAAPVKKLSLDPGKRVAMVNSDQPPYVLTEDGSRYFVGSLWPGGQRISDISDGRVLLDKAGVVTELKF